MTRFHRLYILEYIWFGFYNLQIERHSDECKVPKSCYKSHFRISRFILGLRKKFVVVNKKLMVIYRILCWFQIWLQKGGSPQKLQAYIFFKKSIDVAAILHTGCNREEFASLLQDATSSRLPPVPNTIIILVNFLNYNFLKKNITYNNFLKNLFKANSIYFLTDHVW